MGSFFGVEGFEPSPSRNGLGTTAVNTAADRCKEKNQGRLEKDKISIFIFQIENSIQIFEDRFVWYHETRDTAQSGLFLFPAEMKKTASKYIAEEEYEEVTF